MTKQMVCLSEEYISLLLWTILGMGLQSPALLIWIIVFCFFTLLTNMHRYTVYIATFVVSLPLALMY